MLHTRDYEPWKKNRKGGSTVQQGLPMHHSKEKIPLLCPRNASQLLLTNTNGWMTVPSHPAPWLGQWDSPCLPCPAHPMALLWSPASAAEANVSSSNKMEMRKVGRLTDSMVLAWDTTRSAEGRPCLQQYPGDSLLSPRNRRSQQVNPPPACTVDWDS